MARRNSTNYTPPAISLTLASLLGIGIIAFFVFLNGTTDKQQFSLGNPARAQVGTIKATLIKTTLTSGWSPASPDPSGIAYWSQKSKLLISDGEVDEMTIFTGKNVYSANYNGALSTTSTTTAFSKEPTGVAINPSNGHVFFSDDDKRSVFEVTIGADGIVGTSDDTWTSFKTTDFGSTDPEGIAYGENKLFIADGVGSTIYTINPGSNGKFDGVSPTGDDTVTSFSTSTAGETDPEGVEYNAGSLFVVGHGNRNQMLEFSLSGQLLTIIDISAVNGKNLSGVTYGPSSDNSSKKSFYIVDRAVDNNTNPTENDGKLYEIRLDAVTATPTGSGATPTGSGTSTTLTPSADAHVDATNPTTNYGTATQALVDGSPIAIGYIKFDTTQARGKTIKSAILRIRVANDRTTGTQYIKPVSNTSWSETGVTYNSRPSLESQIGSFAGYTTKTWYTVDVTSYVSPRIGSVVSFGIDQTSGNSMTFYTRESASKPELILTY